MDLDGLIDEDHPVRTVWEFAKGVDLEPLYERIKAVPHAQGRTPTDPRLLFALWIWATLDAVGSARELARRCAESSPYRWLCGGVSVNYHSLSDFRVEHGKFLQTLLIQCVAAMQHEGLVQMDELTIDGTKIRASAGASSFRRKATLEKLEQQAKQRVDSLREELEDDPGKPTRRQKAARERAERERKERIRRALEHVEKAAKSKKKSKKDTARASTTDPEARVMKMSDGGFRPAYNVQIVGDADTQVIVGTAVTNRGTDMGELEPQLTKVSQTFDITPESVLADSGYAKKEDIESLINKDIRPLVPPQKPKTNRRREGQAHRNDSPQIAQWRADMASEEGKKQYRRRCIAELINARLKNWGLGRILVRGLEKVQAVVLWFALAHNFRLGLRLRAAIAS
jgi:transposase